MSIKSKDRYTAQHTGPSAWGFPTWAVWDNDGVAFISHSYKRSDAEHIAHCLNAFNHLIASVEALP